MEGKNSSVVFQGFGELIFNQINIEQQKITSSFEMKNNEMIIISNLRLYDLNLLSQQPLFVIENIKQVNLTDIFIEKTSSLNSIFRFFNVTNIYIRNLTIRNCKFISNLFQITQTDKLQLRNGTFESIQQLEKNEIQEKFIFYAISNKDIQFNQTLINNLQNFGFLNVSGLQENSILYQHLQTQVKINGLELVNYKIYFTQIQIIAVKFLKIENLSMKKVDLEQRATFFQFICKVEFNNVIFEDINKNQNRRQLDEAQSIQKFYIFESAGVQSLQVFQLNQTSSNNIGILRVLSQDVIDFILVCQNIFLNNITIDSQMTYFDLPLFYLEAQIINAIYLDFQNTQSNSNIIQARDFKIFDIMNSNFKYINLKYSSIFQLIRSKKLIINDCLFESNISLDSQLLNINELEQIELNNNIFQNNTNDNAKNENQASYSQIFSNIQISNCNNLNINGSKFINNTSYNNGGDIFLIQIKNITIFYSIFKDNKSGEQSGGAIYSKNSNGTIHRSSFISNEAIKERGGAIYADNSKIQISFLNFIENKAFIGGAIYQTPYSSLKIEQNSIKNDNKFIENQGIFYGNNIGSQPQSIKRIYFDKNKTENTVQLKQFQSGGFTKEEIYISFFDGDNRQLIFPEINETNQSQSIIQEIKNYQIQINESSLLNKDLIIVQGSKLTFIKELSSFKLNFTALSLTYQKFNLNITTNIKEIQIEMDLEMRDCQIGELKHKKQNYTQCDECQAGSYSLKDPNSKQENQEFQLCKDCPKQASFCKGRFIGVKDGFWRSSNLSDQFYECQYKGCSEKNGDQNGCTEGYIGPLCQTCDYKGEIWGSAYGYQNNQCLKCSDLYQTYVYITLGIIVQILYISFILNTYIFSKVLLIKLYYMRKLDILFLSKTRSSSFDTSVITKILMHYIQIFSVTLDFFTKFTRIFQSFIDIGGDPVNFTYKSYDCLFSYSPINYLWLNRLIIQIAQMLISFIFSYLINYMIYRKELKKHYFKVYIVFTYLFYYPSMSKLLISQSFCKEIDGEYYMNADYMTECFTKQYTTISLLFIYPITLIWTLILPLVLLYKIRKQIQKKKLYSIQYILSFHIIQQGFKEKYYYWEIVRMIQKLLIMIVINLPISQITQKLIIVAICFIYLSIVNLYHPYNFKLLMDCEVLIMQVLILSIIFQVILDAGVNFETLLVVILLLLNIFAIIKMLIAYINIIRFKIRRINNSILIKLLLKIPFLNQFVFQNTISLMRLNTLWKKIYQQIQKQKEVQELNNLTFQTSPSRSLKRNVSQDNTNSNILVLTNQDKSLIKFSDDSFMEFTTKVI